MEGKEVKCSCKLVYRKVLLIAGIIAGALLAVLGIVTITADTSDLFGGNFFRWYTTDTYLISFKQDKTFSRTSLWARPHEFIRFEWDTNTPVTVFETTPNFNTYLKGGLRSSAETKGRVTFALDNLTVVEHYFCKSNDGYYCSGNANYHFTLHMYRGNIFYGNSILGNQNYRWTFFILACLTVAFGVIMILGELHVPLITTKFTFFYYSFIKGLIYVAIGFLIMGMSNILGLFIAMVMWVVGILNCIYGWRAVTTFQWHKVGARGTTTIVTRREYI